MQLLPDQTIVWQWLIFLIAITVMSLLVFKPLLKLISQRKDVVEGKGRKAASDNLKADILEEERDVALRKTREEVVEYREKVFKAARVKARDNLMNVRKEAVLLIDKSKKEARMDAKKIEASMHQLEKELANELADSALKEV